MKKLLEIIFLVLLFTPYCFAEIMQDASLSDLIFPIPQIFNKCQKNIYVSPELNIIKPILKVNAPAGYGLDDRFSNASDKFTNFSFPCGGGNVEACKYVKEIILESGIEVDLKIGNLGDNEHFREYSKSGKLINAYNALILASKSKRK